MAMPDPKMPDPNKSVLPNPDPEKRLWHRLFMFWESYGKEFANLLRDWHNSAAQLRMPGPGGQPRSTGNKLYDSFLDTWGKGDFVDPKVDLSKVDLSKKSYFAALATASFEPLDQCLGTLKKMLITDANGNFTEPPELKVTEDQANAMADPILKSLGKQYRKEADVLEEVDDAVKKVIGPTDDSYLLALIRMMDIETNCFKRQAFFLDHGELDPSNPAP